MSDIESNNDRANEQSPLIQSQTNLVCSLPLIIFKECFSAVYNFVVFTCLLLWTVLKVIFDGLKYLFLTAFNVLFSTIFSFILFSTHDVSNLTLWIVLFMIANIFTIIFQPIHIGSLVIFYRLDKYSEDNIKDFIHNFKLQFVRVIPAICIVTMLRDTSIFYPILAAIIFDFVCLFTYSYYLKSSSNVRLLQYFGLSPDFTKLFKQVSHLNKENCEDCSICLSLFDDKCVELSCSHNFHLDCIKKYIQANQGQDIKCPLCRSDIV